MQRLFEIGFQRVGSWSLKSDELVLQLDGLADRQNVLYAFVSGSTVKYVGKTTQSLQRRMFGYQKPNVDQRTNWRNRIAIVEFLKRGQQVDILVLADTGLLRYGSFHLNLAAGLENSIIQILKPEWNGGRTSAVIETPTEANPPDNSVEAKLEEKVHEVVQRLAQPHPAQTPPHVAVEIGSQATAKPQGTQRKHEPRLPHLASLAVNRLQANMPSGDSKRMDAAPYFILILQDTYHRRGFFNVPVNSDKHFGRDAQNIKIYCGREKLEVIGKINRTANTNGTPRIMGAVPLREWFQKRKAMCRLKISIVDPTTIHISDA